MYILTPENFNFAVTLQLPKQRRLIFRAEGRSKGLAGVGVAINEDEFFEAIR